MIIINGFKLYYDNNLKSVNSENVRTNYQPIFNENLSLTKSFNNIYTVVSRFTYNGSNKYTISNINIISFISNQSNEELFYSVRIYDRTHNKKIGELTNLINTEPGIISITQIENVPLVNAVWELQIKTNDATKGRTVFIDTLQILAK
jgi:hypothetical protein